MNMKTPPPKRRHGSQTGSLRRSPHTRIGYANIQRESAGTTRATSERLEQLTAAALSMGAGRDIAAMGDTGKNIRMKWSSDAARIVAIVVVLITLVVVTTTLIQSSEKGHAEVPRPIPQESSQPTETAEPEKQPASNEKDQNIVVYVSGAVNKPGIVSLGAQARVNEAVEAAGGALENADLTRINLAATVTDAEHIHVPKVGEEAREQEATVSEQQNRDPKVDINTADSTTLQSVPGIGPATAQAIVKWRQEHGKFAHLEQLTEVPGIGLKTLERLQEYIRIG
ncbi:competence protein ComEA [Arcanobacterium phocae]|uniref:Competence protein ComEA n=2 Tax=Arcanobacterium phocae TaxID=131112 RepID=A0A1H2LIC3_9ACTO|nr:competence protein ComEA [Arcanobacterium phocae]